MNKNLSTVDAIQTVLDAFATIRPLLQRIAAIPLLPAPSRKGLATLIQSLDALAVPGDGDGVANFKAGRDL